LVAAIQGIAEACKALAFPVVSGNVSLYNETNGVAIPPTPCIGGVGLVADVTRVARIAFANDGDAILLVGAPRSWGTHLGRSVWLREIAGREEGPPPPVNLAHEKQVGDLVRGLIRDGLATAVHDCSDGGLAVALAEMAMASGIGATVNQIDDAPPVKTFFGEDQGRYVVTVRPDDLERIWERTGKAVFAPWIGNTGGTELKLGAAAGIAIAKLNQAYETWFPDYMTGAAP
jgi:phosphoribosylformylglycinamidine synthase